MRAKDVIALNGVPICQVTPPSNDRRTVVPSAMIPELASRNWTSKPPLPDTAQVEPPFVVRTNVPALTAHAFVALTLVMARSLLGVPLNCWDQLRPASVVATTRPLYPTDPTAQACWPSPQAASFKMSATVLEAAVQFAPPSLVSRMVPLSPTAKPCVTLAKATPRRCAVVPELCGDQVSPPSLVARMVPDSPTIHPCIGSTKSTPCSLR